MPEKYFIISNSKNPKEYLKPYPFEDSKQYVWGEGLIGAAGFIQSEAFKVAKDCVPQGNVIPIDSLTKNVIKK